MSFWWVNQGQTYAEERQGNYLWAPKRSQAGRRLAHWDSMTAVEQDDLIVHYVGKPRMAIVSVSLALNHAIDASQPQSLRRTGLWTNEGRLVMVQHVQSVTTVPRDEAVALGPEEAPFTSAGTVKQGYLWPLTPHYGQQLLDRLNPDLDRPRTSASSPAIEEQPGLEKRTVPLEEGRRLHYDQVITAARRTAVRNEWSLVERLVAHLAVEPTRREYSLPDGTKLWSDLWIEGGNTIVEAKATAGRMAVREGIGQLYDYAHKEQVPVHKVLLVPTRPAEDLLEVLYSADITAIWPEGAGWCAATDEIGGHGQ